MKRTTTILLAVAVLLLAANVFRGRADAGGPVFIPLLRVVDVATDTQLVFRIWSDNTLEVGRVLEGIPCWACPESQPRTRTTWIEVEAPPTTGRPVDVIRTGANVVVTYSNGETWFRLSDSTSATGCDGVEEENHCSFIWIDPWRLYGSP